MTDQYIQVVAGTEGTTTCTATITGVTAGSTLEAWLWAGNGTEPPTTQTVVDAQGSYSAAANSAVDTVNTVWVRIFYLQNATAGTHNLTGTVMSGQGCFIVVAEVKGLAASYSGDEAAFTDAPGTGGTISTGSMTVSGAATLSGMSTDSASTSSSSEPTVGSGFTTRLSGTNGTIGAWNFITGAAAANTAVTWTAPSGAGGDRFVSAGIAILNASASGAIAGTAALTFGATGTLTSPGALAGTATLTFGQTGALTQPPLQYSDTASSRNRPGRGPFSTGHFFVSDISAYSSANSIGALAGTSALTFGETGTLAGAGALAGTSALVVGESGVLTGAGALAATAALMFSESGTLTATGALAGTSNLLVGESGTLAGSGALSGASALTFGTNGALTGSGALAASAALLMGETGVLAGAGKLTGESDLVFSASGTMLQPGLNGIASLVIGQMAVISGAGALAASCLLSFASNSTLAGTGVLAGTAAVSFGASGTATLPGMLAGTASLTFGGSAALAATGQLAGTAVIAFGGTGTTTQPGAIAGAVNLSLAASGTLTATGALTGISGMTFSANGVVPASNLPGDFADIRWVRAPRGSTNPYGEFYQRVGEVLWYGINWEDWLAFGWEPNASAQLNQIIRPSVANGFQMTCTQAGQTGAVEPDWATYAGGVTSDGGVVWQAEAIDDTSLDDAVSSNAWTAANGITVGSGQFAALRSYALIGTAEAAPGVDYGVQNVIVTAGGQQKVGRLRIKVR